MTSNFRLSEEFLEEVRLCRPHTRRIQTQDIFFPIPDQWGLRGDRYLWAALAVHVSPDLEDIEDFRTEFRRAFEEVTGHRYDGEKDMLYVERFAHGGMSSGGISLEWWRDTGLPLLRARFDSTRHLLSET